jgi:hypothetical protein
MCCYQFNPSFNPEINCQGHGAYCMTITMCFYTLKMPLLNVFKKPDWLKGALMTLGHAMGVSQFVKYTASERHTFQRKVF